MLILSAITFATAGIKTCKIKCFHHTWSNVLLSLLAQKRKCGIFGPDIEKIIHASQENFFFLVF